MDVTEAILKRRSIRKWKSLPVEREKLDKVLEAGRRAPSWGNSQPWRFVVTQDPAKKAGLAAAGGGQTLIEEAPVAIVCCGTTAKFTRKLQRDSLKELMDVGALNGSTDLLDNVVLESERGSPPTAWAPRP